MYGNSMEEESKVLIVLGAINNGCLLYTSDAADE